MLRLTHAGLCALLSVLLCGAFLTAQAQETPPPNFKWPVAQPYLVFYDDPPTPLRSPAAATLIDSANPDGFKTSTRYSSPTALATTYKRAGLSAHPQPADFSVKLLSQEKLVAELYVPRFEYRQLLAPNYGVYLSDDQEDIRFKLFADTRLGDDTYGEYSDRKCLAPRDENLTTIAVNPKLIGDLGNVAEQFSFRTMMAHELLHGSQSAAEGLCKQKPWTREGGAEGYVADASWRSDLTADFVKRLAEAGGAPYHGLRKYFLPLDLDDRDIIRFAEAGGVKGLGALSKDAVLEDEDTQEYATGSYFEYLLAAEPSGTLARTLFYEKGDDRKALYALIQDRLKQEFPEHLAKFYTEYASWGAGRYKYISATEEGKRVVLKANDEADENKFRNAWLRETFACDPSTTIELTENKKSARSSVLLKNVAPLSGRCFRVKWKNVPTATNFKIQLLVHTDAQAEALTLGHAYLSGATINGSRYKYCYQNVTEGGGTYGEPIENRRAFDKPVDTCLFRVSSIENVEYAGEKYRALTFATKFAAGKSAGEAVFIVTNAARVAKDNAMFDVRALVSQNRVTLTMDSGRTFNGADGSQAQLWDMVANHRDFYAGGVVKLSRDVKIDTTDVKNAIASLPNFDGDAAITVLSTGDFTFNIADSKDGVVATLMSSDARLVSVGGATGGRELIEKCGLVNDLKVKARSTSGLELTYVADMVDLYKLVSGLMRSREDIDCAAVRAAVVDRATVEAYLPDGRMHLYDADIGRVFPEGYDDAVAKSLSPLGIADNGGLPRRKDLSTFLAGMPGSLPIGGPSPSTGGFGGPGGSPGVASATPGLQTVADGQCATPETSSLIAKLNAIANPCDCACASLERDRTLYQEAMMNSMTALSGSEACIDAASEAMSSAGERMQACMTGTCRSALSGC